MLDQKRFYCLRCAFQFQLSTQVSRAASIFFSATSHMQGITCSPSTGEAVSLFLCGSEHECLWSACETEYCQELILSSGRCADGVRMHKVQELRRVRPHFNVTGLQAATESTDEDICVLTGLLVLARETRESPEPPGVEPLSALHTQRPGCDRGRLTGYWLWSENR